MFRLKVHIYSGKTVQEMYSTATFQPETLSLDPHSEDITDSAQTSGQSVPASNLRQVQEQLRTTFQKRLRAPHG